MPGDVKITQELLRHSSIKVTMDLYAQAVSEEKRVAHSNVVQLLVGKQGMQFEIHKELHDSCVPFCVPRDFTDSLSP